MYTCIHIMKCTCFISTVTIEVHVCTYYTLINICRFVNRERLREQPTLRGMSCVLSDSLYHAILSSPVIQPQGRFP